MYLREWSSNGVICVKFNNKIFKANISSIAQERYFYRLPSLSPDEFDFVVSYLRKNNDCLFDKLKLYVESVLLPPIVVSYAERNYEKIETVLEYVKENQLVENNALLVILEKVSKIKDGPTFIKNCPFYNEIKKGIINLEENINCDIESNAKPCLESICNDDGSFFNTQEGFELLTLYMIHQLYRTPKYLSVANDLHLHSPFTKEGSVRILAALRLPIVSRFHARLLAKRSEYSIYILNNRTKLPFITGDQPLVNLDAARPVEHLDIFFPISPKKAILFCKNERFSPIYSWMQNADIDHIDYLNRKICESCCKQIYSSEIACLENDNYVASYY